MRTFCFLTCIPIWCFSILVFLCRHIVVSLYFLVVFSFFQMDILVFVFLNYIRNGRNGDILEWPCKVYKVTISYCLSVLPLDFPDQKCELISILVHFFNCRHLAHFSFILSSILFSFTYKITLWVECTLFWVNYNLIRAI